MTLQWTPVQQAEHRKLWTAALRSGDYVKGEGCLQSRTPFVGTKFCCLGVGNEVYNSIVPEEYRLTIRLPFTGNVGVTYITPHCEENAGHLTEEVAAFFGITRHGHQQREHQLFEELFPHEPMSHRDIAVVNDKKTTTFEMIADAIDDGAITIPISDTTHRDV